MTVPNTHKESEQRAVMTIEDNLEACLNGGAILFCGAGFSADCLNFEGVEIGCSHPLLEILNHELEYDFEDIQTAADDFISERGHNALMNLLKNRYEVRNIPQSIIDLLAYPWDRIYTTNYDDSIALALQNLGRKHIRINNLDDSRSLSHHDSTATQVIHLHGAAISWNVGNFEESCILGAQSYLRHDTTENRSSSEWKSCLGNDYNRSKCFVFVGFSAKDYHLNRIFYNATASRDKVFFINQVGSHSNRQLIAGQREFGTSLPIGRDGFSSMVKRVRSKEPPSAPRLASFEEIQHYNAEEFPPGIDKVTDHLIYGKLEPAFLVRDMDRTSSEYRVKRHLIEDLIEHVSHPGNIGLVTGSICTGKTSLLFEIMQRICRNRRVFHLRVAYSDVAREAEKIISAYPTCVLCIDECFMLGDELLSIAETVDRSQANLLLTSRDVAYDSASDRLIVSASSRPDRVKRFQLSKLVDTEVNGFIALSERIAGWGALSGRSSAWKKRYIEQTCHSNMAEFLLHLLQSKVVKQKVEDEYHRCISVRPKLKRPLIVSLYLQHIGLPVQLEVISTLLKMDVGKLLNKVGSPPEFEIIRRDSSYVRTLQSIGAREILKRIVEDKEIVDVVVGVIHALSENRYDGQTYVHIFNQFMRYPILQGVVVEKSEIDRFFDQLSLHPWVNRQTHFWLQFSMAKTDFGEYEKARIYLDNAYGIEDEHQRRGNRGRFKQLDDQRAKFLLKSRTKSDIFSDYFPVLNEVSRITRDIFRMEEVTFHIYDTLSLYCEFVKKRFPHDFPVEQHEAIKITTRALRDIARRRSSDLTEYHAANRVAMANNRLDEILTMLDTIPDQ